MQILMWIFIVIAVLVVLFFLAIMPRMLHKPDRIPFLGVLYAHRGLHDNQSDAPENSLKAFGKAVEAGYGIELDVQLSKDKVPVVFHDFTLERVCGVKGKVCDYTFDELQQFHLCNSEEKIPTFAEFLQLVDGKVPLIVELKVEWTDVTVCTLADELLRAYKGIYCIESFNPLALIWYRNHHKEVMRGQLAEDFKASGELKGILYSVLKNLLLNFLTKPDFVAFNHFHAKCVSRRICHKLYGNLAAAWTIKSQTELEDASKQFEIFIFDSFIPQKTTNL